MSTSQADIVNQFAESVEIDYREIARRIFFSQRPCNEGLCVAVGLVPTHVTGFVWTQERLSSYVQFINNTYNLFLSPPAVETARADQPDDTRETTEDKFKRLADEWKRDRGHASKIKDLAMHGAYQSIIGMGPSVVPFILREMEERPDHWTWALRSITQANPVTDGIRGNLKEMAKAWVIWGKSNGYCW